MATGATDELPSRFYFADWTDLRILLVYQCDNTIEVMTTPTYLVFIYLPPCDVGNFCCAELDAKILAKTKESTNQN
jgi:hypothetical protein